MAINLYFDRSDNSHSCIVDYRDEVDRRSYGILSWRPDLHISVLLSNHRWIGCG